MADVRKEYRELSPDEKLQVYDLKQMGETFILFCEGLPKSRETSLAITKMEEAIMWATKGLTK